MQAHRTPWQALLLCVIIGGLVGFGIVLLALRTGFDITGSPWVVPVVLVLVAAIVFAFAWNVHKYAIGKLKFIEPRRAFNTLVCSKALSIAGAVLLGWYAGQIVGILGFDLAWTHYYSQVIIECAIAGGAALIDLIVGAVGEWLCQLPPIDGPENPKVKMKRRKQAV
jgi:hypothetical protein